MFRLFQRLALWLLVALGATLVWADDFLEPEKAFRFSARMVDAQTVEVSFRIADGYYMYRERFAFQAEGAQLGTPVIPPGKIQFDETFQKDVETYRNAVAITLPVETSGSFVLKVTSQGCADQGLCYSPMESVVRLTPTGEAVSLIPDTEMGRIESSLQSGKLSAILPLFLLLGLGLSLTPCVLPMVPILSSIIVGEGAQAGRKRGFVLSLSYSLGMAVVYTALGVAAGLIGEGLSAALQNPWVLGTFALLIVLMALSMFDLYQLQMPQAVQGWLTRLSSRQSSGKLAGVFAMGAISALIVGPCVAAPLAAVLLYISQTRDVLIGGSALFAMAAGMSVPLLLIGISAGALLPRTGPWMRTVKFFFGILMLGLAVWLVSPVVPAWVTMLGWALLGAGYGMYVLRSRHWIGRVAGLVFIALGLVQAVGLATGGRDPLAPLSHLSEGAQHKTRFVRVKSVADLDAALARAQGKAVMLDFYADWCVSCIEMEKLTFSDPRIRQHFADMMLLQADVTANDADDKALLKRFRLFGPPGIIFFDGQGKEIPGARVIGYQDADKFDRTLSIIRRTGGQI